MEEIQKVIARIGTGNKTGFAREPEIRYIPSDLHCVRCNHIISGIYTKIFWDDGTVQEVNMPAKYYNEFTKLCDDCINADQEKAKQRERSERFLRSFVLNLPVIHRESTFENFMPDAENQEMTEAVKAFAVEPRGFLALFGSKGIGKTHLAVAAGKSICLREIYCRYITAVDLAKWLRKASSSRSEYNPDGVVDGLADVPILVLDDLGKERPTEFVQEHLFRLFDCRWANRMATLIISNLGPEDMNARLGEAMVDRITAGKIITIKGRSRRVGNKNEAHDDFA